MKTPKYINPFELKTELEEGSKILLLDVRRKEECDITKLQNITNIELQNLIGNERQLQDATKICIICKAGIRALKAFYLMPEEIQEKSYILEGGMDYWNSCNP